MKKATRAAVAGALVAGLTFLTAGAGSAAPRFGVHDSQCQAGPDQPHCPGNH